LIDLTVGYGARPWRAGHVILLLACINVGVFARAGSLVAADATSEKSSQQSTSSGSALSSPAASADLLAIAHVSRIALGLPTAAAAVPVKPQQAPATTATMPPAASSSTDLRRGVNMAVRLAIPFDLWLLDISERPSPHSISARSRLTWLTYADFALGMKLVNIVLVPVFVAGVTGFLKRE
jgi:hypothetical protein